MNVICLLDSAALSTWIFGGWAEELQQMILPRTHRDIDLLYPAESFEELDNFIQQSQDVEGIALKRFSHKRAMVYQGVMVEFLLVRQEATGFYTDFFDIYHFKWPGDVFENMILIDDYSLQLASKTALTLYRTCHTDIECAFQQYHLENIEKQ